MSTSTVDLTNMSSAEIKALILSQTPPVEETPIEGQPRDEQGRFVSPQADSAVPPQADPVEETEETEPVVVEKEIDLGDGSGVQVFRGVGATQEDAYAALVDELAKAQANATKKIQELSRPATPAPDTTTTPENEFLLQQRLLDSPRATIREIFKDEFGMTPTEIKAKLAKADAALEAQTIDKASDAFLAANADYFVCEQNGKRMVRQLELDGLPPTTENMQKVYESLKADGLLTPKPGTTTTATRGRASGLSTRTSAVPPPPNTTVDLSKLSTEQLLALSGGYQNVYR